MKKYYIELQCYYHCVTFTRKIVKNGHIYLYEVRSYREKGRVRQAVKYLGKEIEKEGSSST